MERYFARMALAGLGALALFACGEGEWVAGDAGTHVDAGGASDGSTPGDAGAAPDGGAQEDAGSPGDGGTGATGAMLIIEAETFPENAFWARCPGAGCEDDRSAGASDGAHLLTYEGSTTSDSPGWLAKSVQVPHPGTWYLWARSAHSGPGRGWRATFCGSDAPQDFGLDGAWDEGAPCTTDSTTVELVLRDTEPDAWWAYPDVLILTDDPDFDPATCPDPSQASSCLPGNHDPLLTLPARQTVNAGSTFQPALTATDPDGDPLTFLWTQQSGPAAQLADPAVMRPFITAPQTEADAELVFAVNVEDGAGGAASATLTVSVIGSGGTTSKASCAEVTHPWACVEVSACGPLSQRQRYYLLTADVSSPGTCFAVTDDLILDLNGHTVTFDEGFEGAGLDPVNGGFEANAVGDMAARITGWDLSAAPGARVADEWEMPLVGARNLFVPAGGVIVSSWIQLPVADRTYRGVVVQRGPGQPVTVTVEREISGGAQAVCTRSQTDGLGGGKAAFCNFNAQPAGRYRLRVTSPRDQYYDAADIVPARSAGVGAVRYYTSYDGTPGHVCNLDNGSCHLPDLAGTGAPTVAGGSIEIRNGTIRAGSTTMKSWAVYVSGAAVVLDRVHLVNRGVAAQTLRAGATTLTGSLLEADMPWVIDREDITETSATVGSGSTVSACRFVGGQGNLSASGASNLLIENNTFLNRATVTNHYGISLGGVEGATILGNTFNCAFDDPTCPGSSGSGILAYRTRSSRIEGNTFHVFSERCDAEYSSGTFTSNAIRLTDYNASPGATNGVFGNRIEGNTFHLRAEHHPQMPNCAAYANGVFYSVGAGDNVFVGNTFESEARHPKAYSYAFYVGASDNGGVWRDNEVFTNDKAAWFSSAYGPASNGRFEGNRFVRRTNAYYAPSAPDAAFRLGYCCGYEASGLILSGNLHEGGFDPRAFWFTSNQPAPYSLTLQWPVEVVVQTAGGTPVASADVGLQGSGETLTGRTGPAGEAALLMATEYHQSGTNTREATTVNRTGVTPHTLTVTVAGQAPVTRTVTVDRPLTELVTLP